MKKIILATIAVMAISAATASATEVTGTVLSTDIGTLIDGAPCKTYNVDGRTFVIAEDLSGYGFDVEYDDSTRRLAIEQNPYARREMLSMEDININKSDIVVGEHIMDMYATDIEVYLSGNRIEGYAIDGKMVIPVRALELCAYVEFSEDEWIVKVSGLQHYLTSRYESGNPYVSMETTEKEVTELSSGYSEDKKAMQYETIASDVENGTISAYWGNPLEGIAGGKYYFSECFDREEYIIRDADGNLIYGALIRKRYKKEQPAFERSYSYIRTGEKGTYGYFGGSEDNNRGKTLYGYWDIKDRDINSYWPVDKNALSDTMGIVSLSYNKNGQYAARSKIYAITEDGYLYAADNNNDEFELRRHNITSAEGNLYLANDGKVYYQKTEFSSDEANSSFDECIAEDVRKIHSDWRENYILKENGDLYRVGLRDWYFNDFQPEFELIYSDTDISDFAYVYIGTASFAVLENNGDLYLGTEDNYNNGTQGKIADNVREINAYGRDVYYVNKSDELYVYSSDTWSAKKLADNIARIADDNLYITTDGELTNLEVVIGTDATDAASVGESVYILKNDNSLWKIENGENKQIF